MKNKKKLNPRRRKIVAKIVGLTKSKAEKRAAKNHNLIIQLIDNILKIQKGGIFMELFFDEKHKF